MACEKNLLRKGKRRKGLLGNLSYATMFVISVCGPSRVERRIPLSQWPEAVCQAVCQAPTFLSGPWPFAVAVCSGRLPWPFAVAVCRLPLQHEQLL